MAWSMSEKTKSQRLAKALERIGFNTAERKAVMALLDGSSQAEAARIAGYSPKWLEAKMAGTRGHDFRERYELALDAAGLGYSAMANKMAQLADCTKPYYNRDAGVFELYPDNDVQLRAMDHVAKVRAAFAEKGSGPSGVQIVIQTNLGTPGTSLAQGQDYEAELPVREAELVAALPAPEGGDG